MCRLGVLTMSSVRVFIVCCLFVTCFTLPIMDDYDAAMYLQEFGYFDDQNSGFHSGAILSEDTVRSALKEFQRFAGINETGVLDNETLSIMNTPRCGIRDRIGHFNSVRRKRYTRQGSKWKRTELSYRISKYPKSLKDKDKLDKEIAKAFQIWSDVSKLNFEEKKRGRANIEIRFESGEHGDADPFDGPGRTLAHAFFPQYGGDAHFDDDEKWTVDDKPGTDVFQVAAHEFGHSLGLGHSDEKKALMGPFYRDNYRVSKLHIDDIKAIQSLYGSSEKESPPDDDEPNVSTTEGEVSDAPDICQDTKIDTITRTQNGTTYAFKGNYYWKLLKDGVADGYPRSISVDFGGLEGNLDASLTWSNGKTYFFKGDKYWRFTNRNMDVGYPKPLERGFEGIPENLDAAFVWSGNGKTYFFKGDQYWRYDSNNDPPVSDKYPKPISSWNCLPNNIDAAFQWQNCRTYFFKRDKYYRFNDISFEVEEANPSFPRSTAVWWFDCQSVSHRTNPTEETENSDDLTVRDNNAVFGIDTDPGTA